MAAPTSLSGYTDDNALFGVDGYGALVDAVLEFVPDLQWPISVRTYGRMRNDPQLAAIIKVYLLAIMRARWSVDGAGCRDEVTQQVADDLGLPIKGNDDTTPTGARRRNFVWMDHLRISLLDQVFGHMFFEQQWVETGGRFRLAQIQERMPQTISAVNLNADGTIQSIEQGGLVGKNPVIRTANNALVYYVNEREGSNYFGRSPLRPSYGAWLIKDQVMRVHGTSIRRFGLGVPSVTAPPGATPAQVAVAAQLASTFKASDQAGAGLPDGFTFNLTGMTGSVPDALAFLQYLDRSMTRSTLTSLLDMATAERGSRSLGETVMDLMVYAQQAVADAHATTGTQQIVVPLVDANWGEDEPAPQICVGDVGADLELTSQDINFLTQWGAVTHDDELEGWIRQRYGLPPIDPETRTAPQPRQAVGYEQPAPPVVTPKPALVAAAAGDQDDQDKKDARDQRIVAAIAALMVAGLSTTALLAAVTSTLAAVGITADAAKAALTLTGASSAPNVRSIGVAAQVTAASEPTARAAYLLNASQRIQTDIDNGMTESEALDTESRFFQQHLDAQANRRDAANAVDSMANATGSTTLSWQAVMDTATTPDCAAADGLNFTLDDPPAIGWPGAVHPQCRCTAQPAIEGAGSVNDTNMPADTAVAAST